MKFLFVLSFIALLCPFVHSIDNVVQERQSLSERMVIAGEGEHGTPKAPVEGALGRPNTNSDHGDPHLPVEGDSPSLSEKSPNGVRSFLLKFTPKWLTRSTPKARIASDYEEVRVKTSFTWGPEIKPMLLTDEDGSHVGNLEYGVTPEDFAKFEGTMQTTQTGGIVYKFNQPEHYRVGDDPSNIKIEYVTKYFTPVEGSGMTTLTNQMGFLLKRFQERNQYARRDVQLGQLSSTQPSSQTSQADFLNCINALAIVQASIESLLTPVLKALVAKYNANAFINTMAQSVYLDLTGSTTSLIGPFNYGMSYMNTSVTDTAPGTNTTVQPFLVLQKVYAEMWVEAKKAANSTGLLTQQATLVGYLQTNETSLYPADFTTVNKNAKVPSFL